MAAVSTIMIRQSLLLHNFEKNFATNLQKFSILEMKNPSSTQNKLGLEDYVLAPGS